MKNPGDRKCPIRRPNMALDCPKVNHLRVRGWSNIQQPTTAINGEVFSMAKTWAEFSTASVVPFYGWFFFGFPSWIVIFSKILVCTIPQESSTNHQLSIISPNFGGWNETSFEHHQRTGVLNSAHMEVFLKIMFNQVQSSFLMFQNRIHPLQ